jgi:hypothetical protein
MGAAGRYLYWPLDSQPEKRQINVSKETKTKNNVDNEGIVTILRSS